VGQIDYATSTDITDDFKNQITKIVYNARFPQSILKKIPIIVLNNLALTGDQYIPMQGENLVVPELKADFLSEGGLYATYTSGGAEVIFLNKPMIAQGGLTDILTHELGHAIGSRLTEAEWKQFYQLRGIPADTARNGTSWNLSPNEDFAEVYKNIYTGLQVKTYYGSLNGSDAFTSCESVYFDAINSSRPTVTLDMNDPSSALKAMAAIPKTIDYSAVETNLQLQKCRREVMANPGSWKLGRPYQSVVDQKTKDFMAKVMDRLNQSASK
jgi:hypothetical protein